MKTPRVRISRLMATIALIALGFSGLRILSSARSPFNDLAIVGVVPMAIILSDGVLGLMGWRDRPFLLGFVAFGAAALTLYVVLATRLTSELHFEMGRLLRPIEMYTRGNGPKLAVATVYFIAGVIATTPQLVIACLGGSVYRGFRGRGRLSVKRVADDDADTSHSASC